MIYLILAVLGSASMALALRISETFSDNRYGILLGNYLTCLVIAFLFLPQKDLLPAGCSKAVIAGVINGIIFLATLLLMQSCIEKNGTVLTSAFSKLGIVLPVLASILFLGEKPTWLQTGGMLLVVAAIWMINSEPERGHRRGGSKIFLFVLLIFSGMADGMSKIVEQIMDRKFDALYLFYTFLTALILTLLLMAADRAKGGKKAALVDLLSGLVVGIPNYFSTSLLLASLTRLPAYLVYPSFSVGTILVVTIVSVLVFRDRMERRQWYGCGLIVAALALLNI